jgi:acyl-[acyl carrier protein]--UDP-N-acetylglucosamine O-acyltransferase
VIEGHTTIQPGQPDFPLPWVQYLRIKYAGRARLIIGDKKRYPPGLPSTLVHRVTPALPTMKGNDNWLMAYVHLTHGYRRRKSHDICK